MEVTSNWNIEKTQDVKQEEEGNKLVNENVEELEHDIGFLREIYLAGDNEGLKEAHDSNAPKEGEKARPLVKDSEMLEMKEMEKEVINSIVQLPLKLSSIVEDWIENSNDFDMTNVESKETNEREIEAMTKTVADEELTRTKGTMVPSSVSDGVSQLAPPFPMTNRTCIISRNFYPSFQLHNPTLVSSQKFLRLGQG